MATVRDVMKTSLHSVDPSETVGEAVAVMAQHRIGSVLVMQDDRLLGIFTERDTVRALSQAHDAARHEIVSWMTHDPKTVAPDMSPPHTASPATPASRAICNRAANSAR